MKNTGFFAGLAFIVPLPPPDPGDLPQGTVRFSLSYFNRPEEVDLALQAVGQLARKEG